MDAVCDVCGATSDIESLTITWRGKTFIVDLCPDETEPVEVWESAGSMTPRKRRNPRAKPQAHSVTPID